MLSRATCRPDSALTREAGAVIGRVADENHVDRVLELGGGVERVLLVVRFAVGDDDEMRRALARAEADRVAERRLSAGFGNVVDDADGADALGQIEAAERRDRHRMLLPQVLDDFAQRVDPALARVHRVAH